MDVKVYKKETVKQPSGTSYVISPNIIDLYPIITKDENDNEIISGAEELTDENALIEQACALATIWQKGLDPLDLEEGIRWAPETRNLVEMLCAMAVNRCPEFEDFLVPMCVYHGNVCHEMYPCGRCDAAHD